MSVMKLIATMLSISIVIISGMYFGIPAYFDAQMEASGGALIFQAPKKIVVQDITLRRPDGKDIVVARQDVSEWMEKYHRAFTNQTEQRVNVGAIRDFLLSLAPNLQKKPVNARFAFMGGEIVEQIPHQNGYRLNIPDTARNLQQALWQGQTFADIVFDSIEPDLSAETLQTMGIETLVGEGESDFVGSPVSRVHNIKVSAGRYDGYMIEPDAEFSFNDILGEVDAQSGYLPELVIKHDKVIPEYGGGICQVSTTMFRAAITSGLKISERRNHSFPVRYYNPQGYDATIYPGVVDLKFVNDTGAPLLVQTAVTGTKLKIQVFGPELERKIVVKTPVIYEQKDDGSMKTYFVRKILASNGTLLKEERFYSYYKSPELYPVERNPLE